MARRLQSIAWATISKGMIALIVLFGLILVAMFWYRGYSGSLPKEYEQFKRKCIEFCKELEFEESNSVYKAISLKKLQESQLCQKSIDLSGFGGYVEDHCYNDTAITPPSQQKKDYIHMSCFINVLIIEGGKKYVCAVSTPEELAKACKYNTCNDIFGGNCDSVENCEEWE